MPKFGTTIDDEPIVAKPAMDQLPAATKGAAASIPTTYNDSSFSRSPAPAAPQLSEAAQLAKIELEKKQWCYMVICCLDMAVFPVLWSVVQVMVKSPLTQWNPLTLQGAGLFHLAMGAVLGIAAWSRGQEKIQGVTK